MGQGQPAGTARRAARPPCSRSVVVVVLEHRGVVQLEQAVGDCECSFVQVHGGRWTMPIMLAERSHPPVEDAIGRRELGEANGLNTGAQEGIGRTPARSHGRIVLRSHVAFLPCYRVTAVANDRPKSRRPPKKISSWRVSRFSEMCSSLSLLTPAVPQLGSACIRSALSSHHHMV